MKTPEFEDKMILFFQNAFQQSSLAQLDFQFQLRKRPGAFDLQYNIFGDDAFPQMFKNMKESFARTCLALIAEGRPFSEILTTNRHMLTTALKSLYMQIEMPYDIHTMTFKFNQGARPKLTETLDPNSPNYMVFGYEAASKSTADRVFSTGTCAGDDSKISEFPGNTLLFQILLGSVPRDASNSSLGLTQLGCMEHPQKPYFETADFADWQMVEIVQGGTTLASYDLPGLRASGAQLHSKLPRVSFFTTPAFLAVWNTNDSNQHRVTANQALLGALGMGFTAADANIPSPPNLTAVDGKHAVEGGECYGCHKSLDPMRQYFGASYDYNDQVGSKKDPGAASFGFGDVSEAGTSLVDFGTYLSRVTDSAGGDAVNRFALEMTQKLCFFANSSRCLTSDPEMRRVAQAFVASDYDFRSLIRELFSSPLVTGLSSTATAASDGVTVSVARRNQLCQSLSNRLGMPDVCEIEMPTPTNVTSALNRLAGALPADGFSRGSEFPVTAPDPNLFYRAAAELVCESIANKVVDAGSNSPLSSADRAATIEVLVTRVMALPPGDPLHAQAATILSSHFDAAVAKSATPTNAMRSTFAAACLSPSSLAFGI
jgi:hypothetical protein